MKVSIRAAFASVMLLLLPGCATHHLWTESRFAEKHAASVEPHLEIYRMHSAPSFVAVYDEWNPRGPVTRRAYFLFPNDVRSAASKKPRFVPLHVTQVGERVPIFEKAPEVGAITNIAWAVKFSPFSFELYDAGSCLGRHELPVYRDSGNTTAQVLITPVALVADATIVAGIIAAMAAAAELEYHPCRSYYFGK
jgi:hypothetical protein